MTELSLCTLHRGHDLRAILEGVGERLICYARSGVRPTSRFSGSTASNWRVRALPIASSAQPGDRRPEGVGRGDVRLGQCFGGGLQRSGN